MPRDMLPTQSHRTYKIAPSFRPTENLKINDFQEQLLKYFKRNRTKLAIPGDVEKIIRRSLKYFNQFEDQELDNVSEYSLACEYIEIIFSVIECHRITDSEVVRDSLEDYLRLSVELDDDPWEQWMLLNLRRFPKNNSHYKALPGYWKNLSVDEFFYAPDFLLYPAFVKRLLRYGVRFKIKQLDVRYCQDYYLRDILRNSLVGDLPDIENNEGELQHLLREKYSTYGDCRRLYFVLMGIDMVNILGECRKDVYNSLKLIFKTIPDPLITVAEISRFFDIVLEGQNKESSIKEFCNKFQKIFPRSSEPLQPRTLKHLSRCQVRECLILSRKLPHGVWHLHIPETLKNDLLLQKTVDECNAVYTVHLAASDQPASSP